MGLGHTLMEHYIYDDAGRIRNLGRDRLPDPDEHGPAARMESDIVENEDGPGPYGSKGMSEGALLCVAPAVAAAVRDATGVVIRDLPLTPERVWRALNDVTATRHPESGERLPPDDLRVRPRRPAIGLPLPERQGARRRQGGQPRRDGRASSACRCRPASSSRPPPAARTSRAVGRPASTTSCGPGCASVEAAVGRRFGDPADPLLVSVRSGAPVSMPGMMDTILNLGLNDATTAGLARGCRRRGASPGAVASASSTASARSSGSTTVPDDPWLQLRLAIEAVFRSWNSDRARAYRGKGRDPRRPRAPRSPSRRWSSATAGRTSATGVLFTRNPATGEPTALRRRACSTPRARTSSPGRIGPSRSPSSTSACRRSARRAARLRRPARAPLRATCATSSSPSRTAGSGCSRSGSASAARRRRCGSPSTWQRTSLPAHARRGGRAGRRPARSAAGAATVRSGFVLPLVTGLPASPGIASGPIVTTPEAAVAGRRRAIGR